jgi:hypothetical protein
VQDPVQIQKFLFPLQARLDVSLEAGHLLLKAFHAFRGRREGAGMAQRPRLVDLMALVGKKDPFQTPPRKAPATHQGDVQRFLLP